MATSYSSLVSSVATTPASFGTSATMPSVTTTLLTTSVTLTSYVTITTGQSASVDIVKPIQSLPKCPQTIIFDALTNSVCKTSDYSCICQILQVLSIVAQVAAACSPSEATQCHAFQASVCGAKPVTPASVIVTPTQTPVVNASRPISAPVVPPPNTLASKFTALVNNGTGAVSTPRPVSVPVTPGVVPPAGTPSRPASMPVGPASVPVGPASVPVGPAGVPTGAVSVPVAPPGMSTRPAVPQFTGGASAMKIGALAGAIGIMGFVFAEL